ncbi:MAG: CYTH domain-containing protein [Kordiimonadaceae bacterium]|jgi:adenylate cyclase|nr:CYTH domain-containing protein [Kordiimonadaceae bacterium]
MAMGLEIERKFLILNRPRSTPDQCHNIRQGYIAREGGNSVRIRQKNDRYILSIKTSHEGGGRNELEYEISSDEGEVLFQSINHDPIVKTREVYNIGDLVWELDIFEGANHGLMIAEIELDELHQEIELPDWVGPEVTELSKFYNGSLSTMPFNKWRISYDALIERLSD